MSMMDETRWGDGNDNMKRDFFWLSPVPKRKRRCFFPLFIWFPGPLLQLTDKDEQV